MRPVDGYVYHDAPSAAMVALPGERALGENRSMSGRASAACVSLLVLALAGCAEFHAARLYQSGTHSLDRGDAAAAVADLERAAELAPRASEVQNHLGLAYAAAGRESEALDAFRRALELDCDNDAARHNLAVTLHAQQRRPARGEPAP